MMHQSKANHSIAIMSSLPSFAISLLCLFILPLFSFVAKATVPPSEILKLVNEGEFGPYINEYNGDYRVLRRNLSPFSLCFYNTTPNAYTLALLMGTRRAESGYRWVWEANRGNPVRENATLTLGEDGNLILADSDGRIVWQTNTANKGVVGSKILPNGNFMLRDSKGKFIWQSFDYPTDTLLVGQSLALPTKLVSRVSAEINVNGPYSLVIGPQMMKLYYKSPNSPKALLYSFHDWYYPEAGILKNVTFSCTPDTDEGFAYDLSLDFSPGIHSLLARPKYNSTLTFLRLGIDGNIKLFTFYDKVDWGAWEQTFNFFSENSVWENGCQLPERCGKFGVCEDNQCVACPSPNGLLGWSKDCKPKKLTSCGVNDFHYYKIEGVDHFMSKYNKGYGPMKESDCGMKCTKDCKCLGYFYHKMTSKCWIAYDLLTLAKVSNSTHAGYIKAPNK